MTEHAPTCPRDGEDVRLVAVATRAYLLRRCTGCGAITLERTEAP